VFVWSSYMFSQLAQIEEPTAEIKPLMSLRERNEILSSLFFVGGFIWMACIEFFMVINYILYQLFGYWVTRSYISKDIATNYCFAIWRLVDRNSYSFVGVFDKLQFLLYMSKKWPRTVKMFKSYISAEIRVQEAYFHLLFKNCLTGPAWSDSLDFSILRIFNLGMFHKIRRNFFHIRSRKADAMITLYSIRMARVYRKICHLGDLELLWTIIPSLILLAIAIPSLIVLYILDEPAGYILTVFKIIGHQWYWTYEIGDCSLEAFRAAKFQLPVLKSSVDSFMIPTADLVPGQMRLLEVDNALIVPVETPLSFIITSEDVLHSWSVPSLGIKVDAVPGRLNQVYCFITRAGEFYGQCSELCGIHHGFMPIKVIGVYV
jgi:heme/copper-type cytochrome/quinol oxidase subunit 2